MTPEPLYIDVRSLAEYQAGHIRGAVRASFAEGAAAVAAVVALARSTDRPLQLYCVSGARAREMCRLVWLTDPSLVAQVAELPGQLSAYQGALEQGGA